MVDMNAEAQLSNSSQINTGQETRQAGQGRKMADTNKVASLSSVAAKSTRSANKFTPGSGFETKGVHAWFGKHHALADVSLEFPSNTVTALDRKSTRLNSSH